MKKFQRMKEGIKKSCDKSKGEKYCFKEEECIGRGMPCMPQGACPDDKPFRCGRSWKCQENKTLCEKDDARPDPCPRGQQKCPGEEHDAYRACPHERLNWLAYDRWRVLSWRRRSQGVCKARGPVGRVPRGNDAVQI